MNCTSFIVSIFLLCTNVSIAQGVLLRDILEDKYATVDIDPSKTIKWCDSLLIANEDVSARDKTFLYHIMSDAYYYLNDFTMSDEMVVLGLQEMPKEYDKKMHVMMLNAHGQNLYNMGKIAESIDVFSSALPLTKEIGDVQEQGFLYDNIANSSHALNVIEQSAIYLDSALQCYFTIADSIGIMSVLQKQAGNYKVYEDNDNALKTLKSSYPYVPSSNPEITQVLDLRLAGIYYALDMCDSMNVYLEKVAPHLENLHLQEVKNDYYSLLGYYHDEVGNEPMAQMYYDSCVYYSYPNSHYFYQCSVAGLMLDNSLESLEKATTLIHDAEESGYKALARKVYDRLADRYSLLGHGHKAYILMRRSTKLGVSIDQQSLNSKIASLSVQFDVKEKGLRAEIAETQLAAKKKDFILYAIAFGSLAFLVFVVLLYRNKRTKLRFEKEKLEKERVLLQEITEMESQAFRAQMNPHFIFNALNSIKGLVIRKEIDKAADYISEFSNLVRSVLDHSIQKTISLHEEIETLKKYIALEAMRFQGAFDYQLNIADDVDTENIQVPPILLQPFVENAIWHGFSQNNRPNILSIDIVVRGNDLCITVEDNGVGRKQSGINKIQKSHGVAITRQRIFNFSGDQKKDRLIYVDLVNGAGHPVGTKVVIKLPIKF